MRSCLLVLLPLALLIGCAKREKLTDAGVRTQTLHLGNGAEPRDLDPHLSTAYTDFNIIVALLEGLTAIDEASSQPEPAAAERWEVSADGLVYTFHLRENGKWSNGDPVTAQDFIFSIERMLNPALASEYAYMLYPLKGAEDYNLGKTKTFDEVGAKALDPRTLQFTLDRPTAYLPSLLAHHSWFPVHRATLEKHGPIHQRGTRWTRPENFVGNGPFTLETWAPNDRIVVKKNPAYWDAANTRLNRVVFYPISSAAVEESNFRAGQLHITYEVLPDRIDAYRRDDPARLRIDPALETFYVMFNTTRGPMVDKRVRQALARAIDRNAIANSVMRSSRTPAHFFTPPNTLGYTCTTQVPTDFEAARKLLAEAGFSGGKGFPKIELMMNSDPINQKVMEAIQQMWHRELGIAAEITQFDFTVYIDHRRQLTYDAARARWLGDFNDPATFLELFLSNSGNNQTGWKSPKYDELVTSGNRETSPERRFALFQQAEALLLDETPIAPVFFGARSFLIDPRVNNWVPSLLGVHRYQKVWLE